MKLKIFRVVAWIGAIYHIILGLLATFGTSGFIVSLANQVYGVSLNIDPDLFMSIARFAGSYMIAFGLMLLVLALKPYEYRRLGWVAAILFIVRIFDRVIFFGVLQRVLGATVASNLGTIIPIGIMAILLITCMPKEK